MAPTLYKKNAFKPFFLTSSNFQVIWTIRYRFCSFQQHVIQLLMKECMGRLKTSNVSISISNGNGNTEECLRQIYFTNGCSNSECFVIIADADFGSLKSLHSFLNKYLYHILMEFEQNRTILEDVSVAETFVTC